MVAHVFLQGLPGPQTATPPSSIHDLGHLCLASPGVTCSGARVSRTSFKSKNYIVVAQDSFQGLPGPQSATPPSAIHDFGHVCLASPGVAGYRAWVSRTRFKSKNYKISLN